MSTQSPSPAPPDGPDAAPRRGLFIALEGPDGSGKSTQARALAEALRAAGHEVVLTREPGGSPLGEELRRLLLDPAHAPVDPRTEALLFAAARAAHVERTIRPALAAGAVVVTDRYLDSSVAYQGAVRGLGAHRIAELNAWATQGLTPDLTVVLDVDPQTAAERRRARHDAAAAARGRGAARTAEGGSPDRLEQETAGAHETLRAEFLALAGAAPHRYLVLDAAAPPAALTERIVARVLGEAAE